MPILPSSTWLPTTVRCCAEQHRSTTFSSFDSACKDVLTTSTSDTFHTQVAHFISRAQLECNGILRTCAELILTPTPDSCTMIGNFVPHDNTNPRDGVSEAVDVLPLLDIQMNNTTKLLEPPSAPPKSAPFRVSTEGNSQRDEKSSPLTQDAIRWHMRCFVSAFVWKPLNSVIYRHLQTPALADCVASQTGSAVSNLTRNAAPRSLLSRTSHPSLWPQKATAIHSLH